MIITKTPLRLSIVGDGTDLPSFYRKSPGAVFSLAINKYIYVIVNQKFDGKYRVAYSTTENVETVDEIKHNIVRETLKLAKPKRGLEVTTIADIPGTGSGLGSSSALAVGLCKALHPYMEGSELAEKAFCIESELCGSPVGKQDQYASAIGGINYFIFGRNNVGITPIIPSAEWQHDFENSSLLLWTGITRNANDILARQNGNFDLGTNIKSGRKMAHLAHEFLEEVSGMSRIRRLGEIMDEAWAEKKKLADGITNPEIDRIYQAGMKVGAYGGKILGAGGGGFFYFIAPQYHHKAIVEATGLRKIDFKVECKGSEVIYG